MKTSCALLVIGTVLAATLISIGADNIRQQRSFIYGPTTEPATQPTTQPSSLALYAGQKPDEWESYQLMHAYILDRFVRSEGFGDERMPRVEDQARYRRIYADGTRYIVGRVQLISLNGGKEPFAYVTNLDDVKKRDVRRARHVPIDDTTASALDELKMGKEVVLTGTGDSREFIGAVRATSACAKCHDVPQGTLLGAFRYPLIEESSIQQQQISR